MHKAVQMYVNFLQEIYTDIDEESIPVRAFRAWNALVIARTTYESIIVVLCLSHNTFCSLFVAQKIVERYQKWLFMKSKRPEKLLYMPLGNCNTLHRPPFTHYSTNL